MMVLVFTLPNTIVWRYRGQVVRLQVLHCVMWHVEMYQHGNVEGSTPINHATIQGMEAVVMQLDVIVLTQQKHVVAVILLLTSLNVEIYLHQHQQPPVVWIAVFHQKLMILGLLGIDHLVGWEKLQIIMI